MIKILMGGSPCTHWSIAQKNNRETEPEGLGWELFKNYLIAKEKFKPDFFLYENNKSAAQPIKDQIAKELGVDLMYINSALVSAQNRQRFYAFNWDVEQPEDRGILLRDILESGENLSPNEKSYALTTRCSGAIPEDTLKRRRHTMIAEPINTTAEGKVQCLRATCYKDGIRNLVGNVVDKRTAVAEPIKVGEINGGGQGNRIYSVDGKSVSQTAKSGGIGSNTGLYAMPIDNSEELTPFVEKKLCQFVNKYGYLPERFNPYNTTEITDKSPTVTTWSGSQTNSATVMNVEKAGGKERVVYEVKNGLITIKDKQYPIKLADGFYIIRKLTPVECERLQTLPDNYTAAVSNSQRYKGLGNGWTAEVIIHILNGALKDVTKDEEIVVLSMYDGIGTGRYCLDKMGFTNVKYYAYEIDKYAKQVAMSNYPDIIQMGDAFDLRHPDWTIGY